MAEQRYTAADIIAQPDGVLANEAKALSFLRPVDRKISVRRLIERSFLNPRLTEKEIFQFSYGDVLGEEYWSSWLDGEWVWIETFVNVIATHNAKAHCGFLTSEAIQADFAGRNFHKDIYKALTKAAKKKPDWLQGDLTPLKEGRYFPSDMYTYDKSAIDKTNPININSRLAVIWLLSNSNYSDLVPASAKLHLTAQLQTERMNALSHSRQRVSINSKKEPSSNAERQDSASVEQPSEAPFGARGECERLPVSIARGEGRSRGRKPVKRERVMSEMRSLDPAELRQMIGKQMEGRFGAGRTLCEDAREIILSEIDEP